MDGVTGYDVVAFRARFPALAHGYAHFDGPGGSQVPAEVAQAVARTLTAPIANRGRLTPAERFSDDVVVGARGRRWPTCWPSTRAGWCSDGA